MRILVIGHEGYIGRGLYHYFRRQHEVLGWEKRDDLFNLTTEMLKREKIDLLVNLAVIAERASPSFSIDTPGDVVTVGGTRHIAKILKGTDIMWIQMSTREVFGPVYTEGDVISTPQGLRPKFLVHEEHPFAPINSYGKSKLMSEFISESHPRTNVIRLTSCYTDFDHPGGTWVVSLLRAVTQKRPVSLTRNGGQQFRDPLHVNDLGRLMELVYEKNVSGLRIHAGGGDANLISLNEFVQIADSSVKIETAPGGDYGFAFDVAKARQLVGWAPAVSIRERIPVIANNIRAEITEPS